MKKLPEILAPAGSPNAFYAAVLGGADAVYLGGSRFNARISAENFDDSSLETAFNVARKSNVKIYVTLNTLLSDREIQKAVDYARFLVNIGANALILQDVGLSAYIKECCPDLELHASTQMSAHNFHAAEFLKEKGFSRMVVAREVSSADLKILCAKSPIEIEMFVHGALCVCQSGQCLMSSFIGGRSGNRGECAQPCRLNYKSKENYPLSLKDLCLAPYITNLIDIGVDSLKIEGRMKSPEYVFGVTSIYKKLVCEQRNITQNEIDYLSALFSRDGFTSGYFTGEKSNMFGIRLESDKTKTKIIEEKIRNELSPQIQKLKSTTEKALFKPLFFEIPRPLKTAKLIKNPRKTKSIGLRIVFAPTFNFNKELCETILALNYKDKFLENIFFPLNSIPDFANEKFGIYTPNTVFDTELEWYNSLLIKAKNSGMKNCLVQNISHIKCAHDNEFILHGSSRMNICNSESIKMMRECGFTSITLSAECMTAQIRDMDKYKIQCGVFAYGRVPLMVLELCQIKNISGCDRSCKNCKRKVLLSDRTNANFPILADGYGKNILLNSLPLYFADRQNILSDCGINYETLYFTDETVRECLEIIKMYIDNLQCPFKYTRGYLK